MPLHNPKSGTPIMQARAALTKHGYIFLTVWDGGRSERLKQIEKWIHPQSGAIVILEPMLQHNPASTGGVEVYVSTPGGSLQVALDTIEQRSRRD